MRLVAMDELAWAEFMDVSSCVCLFVYVYVCVYVCICVYEANPTWLEFKLNADVIAHRIWWRWISVGDKTMLSDWLWQPILISCVRVFV